MSIFFEDFDLDFLPFPAWVHAGISIISDNITIVCTSMHRRFGHSVPCDCVNVIYLAYLLACFHSLVLGAYNNYVEFKGSRVQILVGNGNKF